MARLVVANQIRLVRDVLDLAATRAGHEVVGNVGDPESLLTVAAKCSPDVALVDQGLTEGPGAPLWETIRIDHGCRVLVLGRLDQRALLEALEGGADGFLGREAPLSELGTAVEKVAAGEIYLPQGMLGGLLRELISRRRNEDTIVAKFSRLSRREREVLQLVIEGASPQVMATALYLSTHTVRTHVQNVIDKLGVHSRAEAASMVIEYDLFSRFPPDQA